MSSGLPQKPRSSRPVRQAAANSALASSRYAEVRDVVNGLGNGLYGYQDDQMYQRFDSPGIATRVDLGKLKVGALRKYAKVYDIPFHPSAGKEDLTTLITRHWEKMVVSEEQVLQNLLRVRGRH